MEHVVVVGGGIAGLAISSLLSDRGYAVTVVEAHRDPDHLSPEPRSINLALSARGLRTLAALNIEEDVKCCVVPMAGRLIHQRGVDDDFQPYDLIGGQPIYSIRRSQLWRLLLKAARLRGVSLQFDCRCTGVDLDGEIVHLIDGQERRSSLAYDALIGADGAHSTVRRSLAEQSHIAEQVRTLRHAYKELVINANTAQGLRPDVLHIWPSGDRMLIALPNVDGTFTATIFLPLDLAGRTDVSSEDISTTILQDFPDIGALVPDFPAVMRDTPLGKLFVVESRGWSNGRNTILIGDAAHAMAPFYGQGMNCALEDCLELMRSIEHCGNRWPEAIADFERRRQPDAAAIMLLSQSNYDEMSHGVVTDEFQLKRSVERELQRHFPDRFVPLYAMVAFSSTPYAQARARGIAQDRIVDRLRRDLVRIEDLDLALAANILRKDTLAPYPQAELKSA